MNTEIQLEDVSKVFEDRRSGRRTEALTGVNFTLAEKETIALLGPSGCGKSTVLNLIAGFLQPSGGKICIAGEKIQKPGPDRGVVFQEHNLFHWLTVEENVAFGLKMSGVNAATRREQARQYVKKVGLEGFEHHHPDQLSGGMRQRVSIARALINSPRVLLMDEPFAALDAQTRLMMQEWLLNLWQEQAMSMLFITHDIDEAILVADRIMVMGVKPGRIVQEIAVPLPRPRDRSVITTPEFMELKHDCMVIIAEQSAKAFS